jgi:hypothetical protein
MSHDDQAPSSFIPVSEMPLVPAEVRQFAPRNERVGALPTVEIPGFLKRGPRTQEDLNLSAARPWHRDKTPEAKV